MDSQTENSPSASRKLVSDDQLVATTGRSRRAWFTMLDDAGAREWEHARVTRWLGGKHEVDAWWAQSVAVEYQNLRGNHSPARNREKFFASATGLFHVAPEVLWPLLDDDDLRRSWLDLEFDRTSTDDGRIQFSAHDGSSVLITMVESVPAEDGSLTSRVVVEHKGLPSEDIVEETTNFWNFALDQLAIAVSEN